LEEVKKNEQRERRKALLKICFSTEDYVLPNGETHNIAQGKRCEKTTSTLKVCHRERMLNFDLMREDSHEDAKARRINWINSI